MAPGLWIQVAHHSSNQNTPNSKTLCVCVLVRPALPCGDTMEEEEEVGWVARRWKLTDTRAKAIPLNLGRNQQLNTCSSFQCGFGCTTPTLKKLAKFQVNSQFRMFVVITSVLGLWEEWNATVLHSVRPPTMLATCCKDSCNSIYMWLQVFELKGGKWPDLISFNSLIHVISL